MHTGAERRGEEARDEEEHGLSAHRRRLLVLRAAPESAAAVSRAGMGRYST